MNLGLEHLYIPQKLNSVSNEELLDAYISMESAYDVTREAYNCLVDCITTMDHLIQIQDVIKQSGSTETIQYLYGQNNISLTMEGLGETISQGWGAVVKWFQELWTKIKNFFKRLFGLTDKAGKSVEEEAKKAKENIKKHPFKADGNVSDSDPTTVAESFTNTNIQKVKSDFDQNICAKANIDMIRSMNDEEASKVKKHGGELATELNNVIMGHGSSKKPVDEKFINESTEMSKALQEMCEKGENIVNSLRTIPEKLKERAEKKSDIDQLKIAQNTIKQAGTVMNVVGDCSKEAAKGTVLIKNRLEAFNKKFSQKESREASDNNKEFNEYLKRAIDALDTNGAKAAIIGYLDEDTHREPMLALKVADKANRIFKEHEKDLFSEDDNRITSTPKAEWSPEFVTKLKASLRLNFSREKIALALEVIRYLRSQGNKKFQIK